MLHVCSMKLSSSKVSRRDYDGLNRRMNNIEDTMAREKANGLSMPEIADRLEVLEKAAADLRVRTVLEEQVSFIPVKPSWILTLVNLLRFSFFHTPFFSLTPLVFSSYKTSYILGSEVSGN